MGIGRMGKRRVRLHAIQVGRIVGPEGGTGRCRRMIFHHGREGKPLEARSRGRVGSQAEVPAPRLRPAEQASAGGDTGLAGGLSRYATMIKGQGPSLLMGNIVGPQRPPPYHCPPSPDHPTLKMSPNSICIPYMGTIRIQQTRCDCIVSRPMNVVG
eukprot:131589-Hanusia_phi.AAC.1